MLNLAIRANHYFLIIIITLHPSFRLHPHLDPPLHHNHWGRHLPKSLLSATARHTTSSTAMSQLHTAFLRATSATLIIALSSFSIYGLPCGTPHESHE